MAFDDGILYVLVHWRLNGAHEPRAHVNAARAEAQGRRETLAVGEATASDEGYVEGLSGFAEEDEVCNVTLADMAGALEAVDAEEIDAELDGALGVLDARALVQDDDASGLELLNHGSRRVACRLDNLDALIDDGLGKGAVVWWHERGEEGDVDAKGALGEGPAALNLLAQVIGSWVDEGGNDAEATCVTNSGGEFCGANVHHATLNDRDWRAW